MMRNLTLSTLVLLLCATSHAQTITQANAAPPFGDISADRYIADDVPWNLLDTVGSGLTWDLSSLSFQPAGMAQQLLSDVASSPWALSVPDANIVLEEILDGYTNLSFFNNSAGQLDLVAYGFYELDNTDIYPNCPTLQMTYPGVLNTIVAPALTSCTLELVDFERRIIAAGNLVTSFGNINNVVLIRTRRCVLVENDGQWITECYNTYDWYQEGNILTPILTAVLNGSTSTVTLNFPNGIVSVNEVPAVDLLLQPNPATDHIVLQERTGRSLGEVRIVSADGRLAKIERVSTTRIALDVQALAPGLYSAVCLTNGEPTVIRFVKE